MQKDCSGPAMEGLPQMPLPLFLQPLCPMIDKLIKDRAEPGAPQSWGECRFGLDTGLAATGALR